MHRKLALPFLKFRFVHVLMAMIFLVLIPSGAVITYGIWKNIENEKQAAKQALRGDAITIAHLLKGTLEAQAQRAHGLVRASQSFSPIWRYSKLLELASDEFDGTARFETNHEFTSDVEQSWSVSNIHTDPKNGLKSIDLAVRFYDRGLEKALIISVPIKHLTSTLHIPLSNTDTEVQTVTIVDGTGTIIANSKQAKHSQGKQIEDWKDFRKTAGSDGVEARSDIDNISRVVGYAAISGTTGWYALASVELNTFNSLMLSPISLLLGSAVLIVLLGFFAATMTAHAVSRRISTLIRYTQGVAAERKSACNSPLPSRITEFEELRRNIVTTQATLLTKASEASLAAQELQLSERRFRAIVGIGAPVTWRLAPNGDVLELTGTRQIVNQSAGRTNITDYHQHFHPDEIRDLIAMRKKAFKQGTPIDAEFRFTFDLENWVWMRARGTLIRDTRGNPLEWVGTMEDIEDEVARRQSLEQLALHDPLTGLGNRALFDKHLETLINDFERGQAGGLLYIDLDYFKQANDKYGHTIGDKVLRTVAERLNKIVRPSDTVARLGGDEFGVLLSGEDVHDHAPKIAARIVHSLSRPIVHDGVEVRIGASIGISALSPEVHTAAQLINQADAALYRAKRAGRNCYAWSDGSAAA